MVYKPPPKTTSRTGQTGESDVPDDRYRPVPPAVPIGRANRALRAARDYRAEWSLSVTNGIVTVHDLLRQARTVEGKPLRKISLWQLLAAAPDATNTQVDDLLTQFAALAGIAGQGRKMRVSSLVDEHSSGKTSQALLHAMSTHCSQRTNPSYPHTASAHLEGDRTTASWSTHDHEHR